MQPQGSLWNRTVHYLTALPVVTILVIVALQTIFSLDARELWYSDEIRHGNAFQNMINNNKWIVLYLNGEVYPDKPPIYFWFISLIYAFLGEISPRLFFIGAAISGAFFTLSAYALSRVLGENKKVSLLACLIILTAFYFITLLQYARMDLLFATFITLSHICIFKGLQKEISHGWMSAGFVMAALATLTKGPLGFIFPIVTLAAFLLCRGRLRRLLCLDIALGLALLCALCLAWFVGAYIVEGPDFIRNIFEKQIFGRTVDSWHHKHPWWHYLIAFPAVMLPWSLVLIFVPWRKKVFTSGIISNISSFLKSGSETSVYLWASLVSGFILLSLISTKVAIYLLPLFPPLSIIMARCLVSLEEEKCRTLFKSFAVFILILGIIFIFFKFFNPWQIQISGALIAGLQGIILGILLLRYPPGRMLSGAFTMSFMMIIWIQPMAGVVAPSMDKVMSPKEQAGVMKDYIRQGYHPVSYRIYSGTYTYYAGHNITETRSESYLNEMFEEHTKVVLAIRQKHWDDWDERPENLEIVHSQFLVEHRPSNRYLLAVRGQGSEDRSQRTGRSDER
jgi:4-amino-4-deoxy-L-arabinose transferase-like glycosyltransferase